jgi:hypothetical protein
MMTMLDLHKSHPGRIRALEKWRGTNPLGPPGPTGATGATGATGPAGASGLQTRATASFTSASLADLAIQNGTLTMAAGWRLMDITTSVPCRLRIYTTTTARTADAARAIGTDPDLATDHGVLFDFVTTASLLTATLSPLVDGYVPSGSAAPYALTNLSGGTTTIDVSLTYLRTE